MTGPDRRRTAANAWDPNASGDPTLDVMTRRRPDGQIAALVLAHLRTHPGLDFSPHELAKVLGASQGTIRRHLLRLAAAREVRQTQVAPARFQITT